MAFARIVTHYVRHDGWLGDGRILRRLDALRDIPAALINGRFDFQAPVATAWELHRRLPASSLIVVDGAGHDADNPGITEALVRATDHFCKDQPLARSPRRDGAPRRGPDDPA